MRGGFKAVAGDPSPNAIPAQKAAAGAAVSSPILKYRVAGSARSRSLIVTSRGDAATGMEAFGGENGDTHNFPSGPMQS